jgi:prepilin-type N-terminal cleavage/methylation domain-containing protein
MVHTRRASAERGFTLIELMIVIAIIAIIASIAIPNLMAAKLSANETAAIATLRNLVSAQAMIQGSGRIDSDNDAIGEFGTFQELSGRVGIRKGYNGGTNPAETSFSVIGEKVNPAIVSPSLSMADSNGFVSKAGYALMILLPDSSDPTSYVHEENTGTVAAPTPGLSSTGQTGGGSGVIGTDMSEVLWCCYAIPMAKGQSGNRAFFVNQSGDVLQSPNDVRKHAGVGTAVDGISAFIDGAAGITSKTAVGTLAEDGDVWKVAN